MTSDAAELARADAAVLPGVGASDAALRAIDESGLRAPIREFAASGRPLLCVCLGMQILFEKSEEGDIAGLGIIKGEVRRLPSGTTGPSGERLKVPHMGWNAVKLTPAGELHPVFKGVPDGSYFYFVHSYHCVPASTSVIAATVEYGTSLCAAVVSGNVVGTQFHPEKSGQVGLSIYRNFVEHASSVKR